MTTTPQPIGLVSPDITWSKEGDPYSVQYQDCYYPSGDGLAISVHTFLSPNNLPAAWKNKKQFTIGELGFGTGLNFFATLQAWHTDPAQSGMLHFVSFEKHPLRRGDIRKAMARWPELTEYVDRLCNRYPPRAKGIYRILFPEYRATLTLCFDDALVALKDLSGVMDCWYLDGFAPNRNNSLWDEDIVKEIVRHSRSGTTLATFSAAGKLRRALAESGFEVEKIPGYGTKRDHVRAVLPETPQNLSLNCHAAISCPQTAIVIGAGIAGTTLAYSLALRGIAVTVLEKNETPGSGASGNPRGVIMPYLSSFGGPAHNFLLGGFSLATQMMNQLDEDSTISSRTPGTGVVQLPANGRTRRLIEHYEKLNPPEELMQVCDPDTISKIAGLKLDSSALFYPAARVVYPKDVCRLYLESSPSLPITFCAGQEAVGVNITSDTCQVTLRNGDSLPADVVVLATAHESQALADLPWLTFEKVAGQITYPEATERSKQLTTTLCSDGYLLPAEDGTHVLGSTYDYNDLSDTVHPDKSISLIERANTWSTDLDLTPNEKGRSAIRTTLYDRLPVVGPLEIEKQAEPARLFISAGFGSRGFTTAHLSAEIISAYICKEPLPVSGAVAEALHPKRLYKRAKKIAAEG